MPFCQAEQNNKFKLAFCPQGLLCWGNLLFLALKNVHETLVFNFFFFFLPFCSGRVWLHVFAGRMLSIWQHNCQAGCRTPLVNDNRVTQFFAATCTQMSWKWKSWNYGFVAAHFKDNRRISVNTIVLSDQLLSAYSGSNSRSGENLG